jgi:hypothetical protein
MSALGFIIRKSFKNSLRELVKKPGKLVLYILLAAVLIGVVVISLFTRVSEDERTAMFWFTGVLFAFVAMFMVMTLLNGLSGGSAIFDMDDVNLLFVSPVNPRKILLYGVVHMAKTAFAASFFIPFQSSNLSRFGIGFGGVMLVFAGFLLSIVVLTLASLLIYTVTNGNEVRKRLVKCLLALMFLPLAVYTAIQYISTGNILVAMESAIKSPFLRFVPIAGWTAEGVSALLTGDISYGLMMFGLNLLLFAGMLVYIALSNPDYYEDVLVATETAYEKKRSISEGNIEAAQAKGKTVKITKTGIPFSGAAALFGKHMRESFRQNRFGFLGLSSVIIVIGAVLFSVIVKELFAVLSGLFWLQIFFIGTGRGLKETYTHYIYLIPESSFKKILWSNMEIMARVVTESVLIFGISGALLNEPLVNICLYTVVYVLFSFLLLGINFLSMRFLGADLSAGLLIMIYYGAVVLIMLPGAVPAVIVGMAAGGNAGLLAGLAVLSGWELLAGLLCFALARGVLHNSDMATMKTGR